MKIEKGKRMGRPTGPQGPRRYHKVTDEIRAKIIRLNKDTGAIRFAPIKTQPDWRPVCKKNELIIEVILITGGRWE